MGISDLPSETIEEILLVCDPLQVGAIAQCSRYFAEIIYHAPDQHLWRELYLAQPLDDPRVCFSQNGVLRTAVDWKGDLQSIIRARTLMQNSLLGRNDKERCFVLKTLLKLVTYVPSKSGVPSYNLLWVFDLLKGGEVIDDQRIGWKSIGEEAQLLARLHTYLGLTTGDLEAEARVKSRAYVYSWRNYSWDNEFGPFQADGSGIRVNWVHVQALHHDIATYVNEVASELSPLEIRLPMSLPTTQLVVPEGDPGDDDWAGVEGNWLVSFCFCDHRELISTWSCRLLVVSWRV